MKMATLGSEKSRNWRSSICSCGHHIAGYSLCVVEIGFRIREDKTLKMPRSVLVGSTYLLVVVKAVVGFPAQEKNAVTWGRLGSSTCTAWKCVGIAICTLSNTTSVIYYRLLQLVNTLPCAVYIHSALRYENNKYICIFYDFFNKKIDLYYKYIFYFLILQFSDLC